MKTIKGKLKLNQFSKNELDQRKLNALKGGKCVCAVTCVEVCELTDGLSDVMSYGLGHPLAFY